MSHTNIDNWISTHIQEASDGLQDCSVSELRRGESTRRNYYIFKIDLVGSTQMLHTARAATYARVAHAYLSTIDRIARSRGAESEQTEYHGDSVLAFWPERGNSAGDALCAALEAHYAVRKLRKELGLDLQARLLLHYAPLVVSRIGPWNETHRVALGIPIHEVAKKEKEIPAGMIWASDEFAKQFPLDARSKFLERRCIEKTVTERVLVNPSPPAVPLGDLLSQQTPAHSLSGLMTGLGNADTYGGLPGLLMPTQEQQRSRLLVNALRGVNTHTPDTAIGNLYPDLSPPAPRYENRQVQKKISDGYTVKIIPGYNALKLPLNVLGT